MLVFPARTPEQAITVVKHSVHAGRRPAQHPYFRAACISHLQACFAGRLPDQPLWMPSLHSHTVPAFVLTQYLI